MPPAKARDPFLDNARYWVMLLVVVGHSMTKLIDISSVRGFYICLYAFHMPLFILISGYTARRYIGDARQIKRMVSTLVIPYLLVEAGLEVLRMSMEGKPITLHVLEPDWLTWFIAALFIWRLTTPIWLAIRWPIPVSILVSLVGGLAPVDDVLAIPQIIGFLPFYVVGMHLRREHFDFLATTWLRIVAVAVLVSAFVICELYSQDWTISWLYWRDGYSEAPLNAGPFAGVLTRAALMLVGFLLAASALALIPHRKAWFSHYGRRTLYCYLLHGFVILWLRQVGFFSAIIGYGVPGAIVVGLCAMVFATLLMTTPVRVVFRPLFESDLTRFFKDTAAKID